MSRRVYFFGLLFLCFCADANAQKVAKFEKYDDLKRVVVHGDSTIYVLNFWATWCAPCVKELPYFERLNAENKNVKVVLVSLDFQDQFERTLLPFLKKQKIKSEVVLLADKNYNDWLGKVNADWSGAIPATLIIQGKKELFAERDFRNFEDLNQQIIQFINNK